MEAVTRFAEAGGPVIGVCNGFQVLCESGLLPAPSSATRASSSAANGCICGAKAETPLGNGIGAGDVLGMPISHGEGNYYADEQTLDELEAAGRVVFRYCDPAGQVTPGSNPNGSARNIAGIINERGNVLGMMPHPERAGEQLVGGIDGNRIWESFIQQSLAVAG